jgi:hypothetical protein
MAAQLGWSGLKTFGAGKQTPNIASGKPGVPL